jgi:hypothetical protein
MIPPRPNDAYKKTLLAFIGREIPAKNPLPIMENSNRKAIATE